MIDLSVVLRILIVVSVIVVLIFLIRHEIKHRKLRQKFIELTGLVRIKIGWNSEEFKGRYRDWPLRLQVGRKGRQTWTQVSLIIANPTYRAFSLAEDVFFRKSESFGAPTFQSGDAVFDMRFIFKTHSEQFAETILSKQALCSKLLALNSVEIELMSEQLIYSYPGDFTELDTDYAVFVLDVLCDIAKLVENFKITDKALVSKSDA